MTMRAFMSAVFMGALAGASPFLLISIPLGLGSLFGGDSNEVSVLGCIIIAILPLILALLFVLPSMLIVGLPITALLSRLQRESIPTYSVVGGISGALIMLLFITLTESLFGVWMCLAGALSGAVTGNIWSLSRPAAFQRY